MTTPHPTPDTAAITCPGSSSHTPCIQGLGVWCTRACIEAQLQAGAADATPAKPKRQRKTK